MSYRINPPVFVLVCTLVALFAIAGCGCGDDDSGGHHAPDDTSVDDTALDDTGDDSAGDDTAGTEQTLLQKFQQALIQRLATDYSQIPYSPNSDSIGQLSLHDGDERFDHIVKVDVDEPVMYSFTGKATIRGRLYRQLLYAWYYPERPLDSTLADDYVG